MESKEQKTILAFGAHPDDVEWRIGGTLLKFRALGYRIKIVDLTRGERATMGKSAIRLKEAKQAAEIIGARRIILNWGDRKIRDNPKNRLKIKRIIQKYKPDILFSPFYQDKHSDHQATGKLLKLYNPIFYLPHSSVKPTHIVNISNVFTARMRAVLAFQSQITNERLSRLTSRLNRYGDRIKDKYGEAFFYRGGARLPRFFKRI